MIFAGECRFCYSSFAQVHYCSDLQCLLGGTEIRDHPGVWVFERVEEQQIDQKFSWLTYNSANRLVSCPDPILSRGKGSSWWSLSTFLSQQSSFLNKLMVTSLWCSTISLTSEQYLYDVVLVYWFIQNQDCWLNTTRKALSHHQTLSLTRGLGMRLQINQTI